MLNTPELCHSTAMPKLVRSFTLRISEDIFRKYCYVTKGKSWIRKFVKEYMYFFSATNYTTSWKDIKLICKSAFNCFKLN